MGLDIGVYTYYDSFRAGSYIGFNEFRELLANEEGFSLSEMIGFGGEKDWESVDTPIRILLDHSDCDGFIWGGEVDEKLIDRLEKIYEEWSDSKIESKRYWAPVLGTWVEAFRRILYDGGVLVFG